MSRTNGGPAFPTAVTATIAGDVCYGPDGMTLRDWFAGQALASLLKNESFTSKYQSDWFASGAYKLADAMLKERDK
jgi:hypothetical protein